jgi:hypothetical protein
MQQLSRCCITLGPKPSPHHTCHATTRPHHHRYPQNGKLLKVWGRFQEWVLHDTSRAARSYAEAVKRGLGDNMLNLTSEFCGVCGWENVPLLRWGSLCRPG